MDLNGIDDFVSAILTCRIERVSFEVYEAGIDQGVASLHFRLIWHLTSATILNGNQISHQDKRTILIPGSQSRNNNMLTMSRKKVNIWGNITDVYKGS